MASIGKAVSEKKMLENRIYIHGHDPETGADNSYGVKTNNTKKHPLL